MIAVERMQQDVSDYIRKKKGVRVNVNIKKGLDSRSPFFPIDYAREVARLFEAWVKTDGFY